MNGKADHYVSGDWNTVCYQCGFKRKASYLVRNWQGYYVCPEHNEPRQPQDFVRGVQDTQMPPWTQPAPTVVFRYAYQFIGYGDGENVDFQLGDGLYPTVVSAVYIDNIATLAFTANGTGLITFTVSPVKYAIISASGVSSL